MAKRRPTRVPGALGLFATGLTGLSLGLTWAIAPAGRPAREPAVHHAPPPEPREPRNPVAARATGDTVRLHFYDVSQGLAALVDLPDGRHILVDAGDAPSREGCGTDCAVLHHHLLDALRRDLYADPIAFLWITHQHSDHIGGARDVLTQLHVDEYVDNGRDESKTEVGRTHAAARERGTRVRVVDPEHAYAGADASRAARLTPVVPSAWPSDCATDPNECSIGLRIDFGKSSVLFTGDAERGEERVLPDDADVTLLQVGHHGSETSSSAAFLATVHPRYVVVSAGHPGVGMNAEYCLPRASALARIGRVLEPTPGHTLLAYDGRTSCKRSHGEGWRAVPVSEHLWATERDGDVVLVTHGDGVFTREN